MLPPRFLQMHLHLSGVSRLSSAGHIQHYVVICMLKGLRCLNSFVFYGGNKTTMSMAWSSASWK